MRVCKINKINKILNKKVARNDEIKRKINKVSEVLRHFRVPYAFEIQWLGDFQDHFWGDSVSINFYWIPDPNSFPAHSSPTVKLDEGVNEVDLYQPDR
jgi:hypothetical protein